MRRPSVLAIASLAFIIGPMVSGPTRVDERESQRQQGVLQDSQLAADVATCSALSAVTDREELASVLEASPILARYRFSPEALIAGRVIAVEGTSSEVVTAANLADKITADAVFVEYVRPDVIRTAAPGGLVTDPSLFAASTYKLRFQVTAQNATTSQPVKLDAWARDSTGLSLDGARGVYAGNFHVALTKASDPSDHSTLASPVVIAITALGATSIEPRPIEITMLAQWHEVSIVVPNIEGETYNIAVSADPNREGDPVKLSVIHPVIRLLSTPSSIIGWGIGESTINVAARRMRRTEGFRVPLTSIHGSLGSGTVILDAAGHGAVRLRSSRDSATTIEVQSAGLISEPLEVPFDAPWFFLGLAVAGGLIGAFLHGRGRQHWVRASAIGVSTAVVMTLTYAVGIDWPARVLKNADIALAGEAVVFVLGVIGALVGVSLLVPGSDSKKPTNGGD